MSSSTTKRQLKSVKVLAADHELRVNRRLVSRKHTFLSTLILFVMFFLIGRVGYIPVWNGSHFDDMEDMFELHHHTTILNISRALKFEHPLLHYHDECEKDGHIHSSSPQHHSNLETLMYEMEHKHHFYLWVAFHVQALVVVSTFLKLFFLIDRTWEWILEFMIVFTLISTFAQFIGFVSMFLVLYHAWMTESMILFIGQFWLGIIELASFLALWSIRRKLNFIKHEHFKLGAKLTSSIRNIRQNSDQESLKRGAKIVLSEKKHFNNFVTDILFHSRANLQRLNLNKEKLL